ALELGLDPPHCGPQRLERAPERGDQLALVGATPDLIADQVEADRVEDRKHASAPGPGHPCELPGEAWARPKRRVQTREAVDQRTNLRERARARRVGELGPALAQILHGDLKAPASFVKPARVDPRRLDLELGP